MTVTASNTSTGLTPDLYVKAARLFRRAGITPAEVRAAAEVWPVPFGPLADVMDAQADRPPVPAAAAAAAVWSRCALCCTPPGKPCVTHPETGRDGWHVARFCTAWRGGLLSTRDLNDVFTAAFTFIPSTVVYAGGAR